MRIFRKLLLAGAFALGAGQALANPCGFEEQGRIVVTGYAVGATAVPADQKERLDKFIETAKFRHEICVFAQVDKQGTKEANIKVATKRAEGVRKYLVSKGVPADAIKIAKQEEAFTFFGLLPSDQDDDRRVFVTHN